MKHSCRIIVCVTNDKYQHVIAVTDTVVEMANKMGVCTHTIFKDIKGQRVLHQGSCVPYRFIKIDTEEDLE